MICPACGHDVALHSPEACGGVIPGYGLNFACGCRLGPRAAAAGARLVQGAGR